MSVTDPQFWIALLQIIGIDILLSGDNAVVIALAARNLPAEQRRWAIVGGTAGAVLLRILFATVIVFLMKIPYLQLIGAVLLFWIAVKLLLPEHESEDEHGNIKAGATLRSAIMTIIMADAVMSLDNVIGIAAAAKGSVALLIIGLLISIPLVVYGSTLVLKLLDRFPIVVTGGGALLGWIAGDIGVRDPGIAKWMAPLMPTAHYVAAATCAVLAVVVGHLIARYQAKRRSRVIDASP